MQGRRGHVWEFHIPQGSKAHRKGQLELENSTNPEEGGEIRGPVALGSPVRALLGPEYLGEEYMLKLRPFLHGSTSSFDPNKNGKFCSKSVKYFVVHKWNHCSMYSCIRLLHS